ncbi:hypothetical protein AAU61_18180 [Desulfocarbo indianensis]|nr:hypothetical protein AAU61_18180 [Desulfocarbo indianensis]
MIQNQILKFLVYLVDALSERIVILGPQGVEHANLPAADLFKTAQKALTGLQPEQLLQPAPAPAQKMQSCDILGRVVTPSGQGPLIRGLSVGLDGGLQVWILQGGVSMVDLGALTAGLIHNLAGPLSVIRSSSELLERFQGKALENSPQIAAQVQAWPPSVKNAYRVIVEHVDQITEATRDLLAKVRGEAARRQGPLDLNDILTRELRFADNNLGLKQSVRQELDLAENLPMVKGLYSDFSQSFRNILRNAMQAMKDSPEKSLKISTAWDESHITIRIQDSGRGIPKADLKRVFEPFFTTHSQESQASGLGLYSVQQLLKPYEVAFEVASEPGCTVFTLRVPWEAEAVDV